MSNIRTVVNINRARARWVGLTEHFTVAEWQQVLKESNNACACCGVSFDTVTPTVDHVIPLVNGGSNTIDNIQPLCQVCNSRKRLQHIDYRKTIVFPFDIPPESSCSAQEHKPAPRFRFMLSQYLADLREAEDRKPFSERRRIPTVGDVAKCVIDRYGSKCKDFGQSLSKANIYNLAGGRSKTINYEIVQMLIDELWHMGFKPGINDMFRYIPPEPTTTKHPANVTDADD